MKYILQITLDVSAIAKGLDIEVWVDAMALSAVNEEAYRAACKLYEGRKVRIVEVIHE